MLYFVIASLNCMKAFRKRYFSHIQPSKWLIILKVFFNYVNQVKLLEYESEKMKGILEEVAKEIV